MNSSTSSSDRGTPPLTLLRLLAAGCWRVVLLGAVLLVGAEIWYRLDPELEPVGPDTTLLRAQLDRAIAGEPTDVLVVGDSSALMGVDAQALGSALGGRRVMSLATMGIVGPAGFAAMLDRYAAAGGRAATILILMHGDSFGLEEAVFENQGFEEMAIAGRLVRRSPPLVGARRKIYQNVVYRLIEPPLPGNFGRVYGWRAGLRGALDAGNGTMAEPNPALSRAVAQPLDGYIYAISQAVSRRLPVLRAAIDRIAPARVRFGLMPIPESAFDARSASTRAAVIEKIAAALELTGAEILMLPAAVPDTDMAGPTHLAAGGRARFVVPLAGALRRADRL